MKNSSSNFIKNLFLPCTIFSIVAGVMSTVLITAFQLAADWMVQLSASIYAAVRANPKWLPFLLLGSATVGLLSSLILSRSKSCRGGGIPTSVAAIQGIIHFKWITSVFLLPISSLLSFICGIPLGTEGPCVQMGTGIGDGVVCLFGKKKHIGWRRYIMTGGASAGFSLATGAPITAIIFSMEELHKRFSPLLFSAASLSVIAAQITAQVFEHLGLVNVGLFSTFELPTLPISLLLIPLAVGILCGICAVLFTKLYHKFDRLLRVILSDLSVKIKVPVIFFCVALIGFFLFEIVGTGHSLIEKLFERHIVWYLLIVIFLVRLILTLVSNTAGITGGIFLPTLAFGAILGALGAEAFIGMGVLEEAYYPLIVILGMVSFLGASSQIPLTACVFAIEALNGFDNILPILLAATTSFLIVELSGTMDLTDAVIETRKHAIHRGKEPFIVEAPLTVYENSFVVGKDLRDVLWPVSCVVLSVKRKSKRKDKLPIAAGDVITVHYKTYDPIATAEEFEILVGDQLPEVDRLMRPE